MAVVAGESLVVYREKETCITTSIFVYAYSRTFYLSSDESRHCPS